MVELPNPICAIAPDKLARRTDISLPRFVRLPFVRVVPNRTFLLGASGRLGRQNKARLSLAKKRAHTHNTRFSWHPQSSSRHQKQRFLGFNSQFRWMPTFGMVPVGLGNQRVKGGGERGSL